MNFTGERLIPNQVDIELEIEHMQRYKFAKQFVDDKIVLDSACGDGYGSDILSEKAKEVYGIDISGEAILEARKKYTNNKIQFIESDITNMPLNDNKFDVVVSYETIEHIDEASQVLFMNEVKRVLKSDGVLIISTPNKSIYSDKYNYHNEFHIKEFYKTEFIRFLRKFFKNVELCNQYFEISNIIEKRNDTKSDNVKLVNDDNLAKFYIAVCSDVDIELDYSTNIHVMSNNIYSNKISRILSLQEEVEERNIHIKKLDDNILKSSKEIERLNYHIEELSKWGLELDKENKVLKDHFEKYSLELENKDKIIKQDLIKIENLMLKASNTEFIIQEKNTQISVLQCELEKKSIQFDKVIKDYNELNSKINIQGDQLKQYQTELNNKIGHIELLLERDRELERIHNSAGWRFLSIIYKIEDILFPAESKRRFLAKIFKKFIKNPKTFLRYLNFENVKKLISYLKNEDMDRVNRRLESFEEKHVPQAKKELIIFNEEIKEYEKIDFLYESNPLVSIVIPVYNQWNYTYNCLKSIKENTDDVSYEIIIADDVSIDETKDIKTYISNINVVRNEINLGFLLNCNNAAKKARGRYIHFLNNDTNVQKNWLSSLVELIETDNNIGMVGSKLIFSNGKLQEAGGIIWNDASGWNYGRLDDPEKPEYNYVKEVDYISGASIMIKKSLWEEIGGFDERYAPAYCEDSDLAFEVRKHGYNVLYQPKSVVVHFEGISNGKDENSGIKSYQLKNKEKFYEKWKEELETYHFKNAENVFQARDRSKNKKTILFIDHYVPHFDKDAGSRTVYQYLTMFINKGFNVKFIGDNYFKHEPYTEVLQQRGIEVLYGTYYMNNWKSWIKSNSMYMNFAFLNRPHITVKYIDYIKNNTEAKIIYYGHDLHFLREQREYMLTGNEEMLRKSNESKIIEISIMKKSDLVYYPSYIEINEIQKIDSTINAKAISAYIYDEQKAIEYSSTDRKDLMFIGGFGHKPNIDAVEWFTNEVFPQILEKDKTIRLYIIGSNPPKSILNLASDNIIVVGYVSDEKLRDYYNTCKIDVVPLRYGAGIKGKVVEAMYYGIPVVTTSIGSEGLKKSEEFLCIQDDPKEFANSVIKLYNDDKSLIEMSFRSKVYINNNFTEESAYNIIKEDFS